MATKINIPLTVAVLALAIVGLSFAGVLQGYAASDVLTATHPSAFCKESDGGIKTQTFGTCTDSRNTKYSDKCIPGLKGAQSRAVTEYYCAPNNLCSQLPRQCAGNEMCVAGACVPA